MSLEINIHLLPVKMTYFTFYAAIGALLPYLVVFMQQIGLSPSECAIIMSVSMVATVPVRTAIGMVADKLRRHNDILIVCCFFAALFFLTLLLVPSQHKGGTRSSTAHVQCVTIASRQLVSACDATPMFTRTRTDSSTVSSSDTLQLPVNESAETGVTLNRHQCEVFCCNATFVSGSDTSATKYDLNTANETLCFVSFITNDIEQMCNVKPSSIRTENSSSNVTNEFMNVCNEIVEQSCINDCTLANGTADFLHHQQRQPSASSSTSLFGITFWMVFAICFAADSALTPIFSIVDGLAYGCLGGDNSKFGKQRLWGSVGFGLVAILSGVLMDTFQASNGDKNYAISFGMFVAFVLATAVIGYRMQPSSDEAITGSLLSNVCQIVRYLELNILLLSAFFSGYMCGVQESFLFLFLGSLGGPHALMGLGMVIQSVSEIALMIFSGRIIEKLGTNWCLCAAFVTHGIRFVLYSFLVNPWCILSIEPIHSITFGLFYPAMANRASELTPPGMHATVQGLIGTLYGCIGRAVGAAVGGVLYDNVGPRYMFRISSGVSFSFTLVLLIAGRRRTRVPGGSRSEQSKMITLVAVPSKTLDDRQENGSDTEKGNSVGNRRTQLPLQ